VSGRLAAVAGATGFLGRHVVQALARAGWRVRVLARTPAAAVYPWPADVETVCGVLSDPAALGRLCAGAEAVVNVAGLVKARSPAEFEAVNVEGVRCLAEAVGASAPQPHLVQVSSLAAREPQLSAYAASKRRGEVVAAEVLGSHLTIVRPSAVYGPGDKETLRLFQAAALSPLLPTFDPAARLALVHVEDAADQIAALAAGRPGRTLAICDARPEGYGWREILAAAARACGRRPRLVRVPGGLVLALAGAAEQAVRLSGRAPMLTWGKARELLHSDWSLAPAELAAERPRPNFDLTAGFDHTVKWYRAAGWLAPS
jgi:uncharacterized protein YbjT (DUF2867 family)